MADYHVGCGIAGIYAGTLNKKGDMWTNKSKVTIEAMSAVAQYMLNHDKEFRFTSHGGKKYVLGIWEVEEGEADG